MMAIQPPAQTEQFREIRSPQQTLMERIRIDGTTWLDHTERMQRIWNNVFPDKKYAQISDAIVIHDLVEDATRTDQKFSNSREIIQDYLGSNNENTYAIGIGLSAMKFEQAAELWRVQIQKMINDSETNFVKDGLKAISNQEDFGEQIMSMINDSKNGITPETMKWRAPMADIESMIHTLETSDIEGLLIKAIEVMDNLYHPNPNRPASAWRDAQELLSFYSPALSIAGFDDLATEARGLALEFLNGRLPKTIRERYQYEVPGEQIQADYFATSVNQRADSIVNTDYLLNNRRITGSQLFDECLRKVFQYIDKDQNLATKVEDILPPRIKTIGSIIEKGSAPDAIGMRVILEDGNLKSPQEALIYAHNIIIALQEQFPEIEPYHTRWVKNPDEPTIEINFADWKESNFHLDIGNHKVLCKVGPKRRSEYQAMHINMSFGDPADGIGIEIQVTTKSADQVNQRELAHHIFYKAKGSLGEFGNMIRVQNANSNTNEETNTISVQDQEIIDYKWQIILRMKEIYKRGERFRKGESILQTATMDEVLRLFGQTPPLSTSKNSYQVS